MAWLVLAFVSSVSGLQPFTARDSAAHSADTGIVQSPSEEHARVLAKWLERHKTWRRARIEDCQDSWIDSSGTKHVESCERLVQGLRHWTGNVAASPFYVRGDFNADGHEGFAAVLTTVGPGRQEKRDAALIVLPGARDVKALKDLDGGVEYVFEDAYPASVTIGFIGKQLEAAKWRQTTEDLTTATPSGSDREWSHYGEADHEVYAWAGAWKNEAGDLVVYYLRYYFKGPSTASSRDLHIKALKASRETVERVRKAFPR